MSEAIQIALIAATPPTFLGLCGILISIINHRTADRKIDHVTTLTNSTLSKAKAEIESLKAEVAALNKKLEIKTRSKR